MHIICRVFLNGNGLFVEYDFFLISNSNIYMTKVFRMLNNICISTVLYIQVKVSWIFARVFFLRRNFMEIS